ncbi:MAG: hypothetical protein NWF14_00220 [Candidatus Bathyarchaeota archaeon]|nr:hypothetical protein [Candidatus Bathyarchaeota archaeon]
MSWTNLHVPGVLPAGSWLLDGKFLIGLERLLLCLSADAAGRVLPRKVAGQGNESSLHSAIKEWYACPGDRFEVHVDGYVVDIVRGGLLIEIQTRNFSAVKSKLRSLVRGHRVRLVYPIARRKWIVRVAESGGGVLSRRRSPKRGRLTDLFDELVRIPGLVGEENFGLEVLMIEEEEIRCADGKGSWRRRGVSIKDRRLLKVGECARFSGREDFLGFLPSGLVQPFSNRGLAECLGVRVRLARRMTYCLRKMGALRVVGKDGNALLFEAEG